MPTELSVAERYQEIGENYRYFLAWRERLFAGYLAVLAALALAFVWTYAKPSGTDVVTDAMRLARVAVPLITIVTSWIFWLLEFRNRDLFHCCQNAGRFLESRAGIYSDLIDRSGVVSAFGVKARHSDALDALVVQVVAVSAGLATHELLALLPLTESYRIPLLVGAPLVVAGLLFCIAALTIKRCYREVEDLAAEAEKRAKKRWGDLNEG